MQRIFVVVFVLFLQICAKGQSVKGVIMDPIENIKLTEVTVQLQNASDSNNRVSTLSDKTGNFIFNNIVPGSYVLKATAVGFETLQQPVTVTDSIPDVDLGTVYLPKKTVTLEGVVVVAQPPAVSQKQDTTVFSASQYKVNPDATVEDLIKKMPGITVDKSGTVTAQGETVKKVTVDGKDFFGDDATMAIRNLPSDVVDKIQVFDRLSDQAQLTGFDDGNSVKALNITTKTGINNGQFGRVYAGYGTDNRYQAGGNISFFKENRRLSFVGNFNNINQQNFATQDLLGVTSSGGGRGGRGSFGGGSNNFMVGQSAGINTTNAFGINYGDKWGKKIDVTGSYFYNNSKNTNESSSVTQTPFGDSTRFDESYSNYTSSNNNHRINLRLEYKIDSSNSIFIIPSLNFQNNQSSSYDTSAAYKVPGFAISNSTGESYSHRNGYNISNNIMYRHSFAKRGRTFYTSFQTNFSDNKGYSYSNSFDRTYNEDATAYRDSTLNLYRNNPSTTNNYNVRVGYTEPVGKKGMIELNYSPSIRISKSNQRTFDYDGENYSIFDSVRSNIFENKITTQNGGINYRLGQSRDNQFSVGVSFEHSKLESDRTFPKPTSVNQSFTTVLPNLRWMKKIGEYSSVRLFYRTNNDFPSISQLQDVVDQTNLLNIKSGNPYLKQSYTHTLAGRYSYVNRRNNSSFFANVFGQATQNYITTATYYPSRDSVLSDGTVVIRGAQFSIPVNLDGYKSLRSFFTFASPVKFLKSNLNLNAGFSYSKLPGILRSQEVFTNSYAYNGGLVLGSNVSEYVDFTLSYNANFNNSNTKLTSLDSITSKNSYINQSAGLQMNLLTKNGWFLQNDVSYQNYSGLSAGYNQSYVLWNAGIGKKFLKKQAGELKLSVFDLLKQNQSVSRSIAAGGVITDSHSQVLTQYFMLTFSYKLRNFGKAKSNSRNEDMRREWRDGQPPGGMPGGGGPPPGGGGPMF